MQMNAEWIFLPVLLQVALTLVVYIALSVVKTQALKQGLVDQTRRALHEDAWPDSVKRINNNIRNQFELPTIFYVLVFALWSMHAADIAALIFAWLFVLSRIVHAYIHTGPNHVPLRLKAFQFGWLMTLALAVLAIKAVLAGILA